MTNALFNDNRLKLGVFGLNVSNGCAATTMGLDGVVLSWVNYEAELAHWISDVLPVMEQAGLRRPYASPTHASQRL